MDAHTLILSALIIATFAVCVVIGLATELY